MLTSEQIGELTSHGYTYMRGLISRDQAAAIEERIWAFLARRGISKDDRATWPGGGLQSKLQGLRQARAFAPFSNARVHAVVDQLLGVGEWTPPRQDGQALLTFPQPGPWVIPHKVWHFDLPARGPIDRFEAVRLLGFVARVAPHGGGTLMVEGSHKLVQRMVEQSATGSAGQSADVRRRLARQSAWFDALGRAGGDRIGRFMIDGDELDGVRVRVVEATGDAGDVCLMHPWMLHNLAMNCADRPRMMMTQTFLRTGNAFYST
jgi:Phytanoyl-CoA dioxygenase (PhyH)